MEDGGRQGACQRTDMISLLQRRAGQTPEHFHAAQWL